MSNDKNYKIVWLQMEIDKLKKDRESLVDRIAKIELKIKTKEERMIKLKV